MKLRDALKYYVLYRMFCAPAGAVAPALPLPMPGTDPDTDPDERMLQPGVYWWCCGPNEAGALMQWVNDRTLIVSNLTVLGSNGIDCAIVLFQLNGVAYWMLSGLPRIAPKGLDTKLTDLMPEPSLADFFLKKAQQTIAAVRKMDQQIQQWLDSVLR